LQVQANEENKQGTVKEKRQDLVFDLDSGETVT
jgi:hypothetical protein